jgi:hypothetical protein
MKISVLIITLLLGAVTTSAFSDEGKPLDLKAMAEMAKAMKRQEALINDPVAMAAMSRMAESIRKSQANVAPEVAPPVVVPAVSSEQGPS